MFNFKKGLVVGCFAGGIACLLHFALFLFMAKMAVGPNFSFLSVVGRWSSQWRIVLGIFIVVTLMFGILAATRPETKRKRRRSNHKFEKR